jgi:hypothetical protein
MKIHPPKTVTMSVCEHADDKACSFGCGHGYVRQSHAGSCDHYCGVLRKNVHCITYTYRLVTAKKGKL